MKVLIVGGGSAGWMTAAALSKFLPASHQIQLIESKEIGTVSVGEATIPGIVEFNQMLGISEREFLRHTKGSFKLGIEFVDWGWLGNQYIHPFGQYGINMDAVPFHHYWLKDQLNGNARPISEYNLEYSAAQQNRFCHPQPNSRSPLANVRYAYHFDATLYADFLRNYATTSSSNRVHRLEADIATVNQHENGYIKGVTLSDGQEIDADLFIDCSGFKGLLIAQTLGVGFEDWRKYLPCDSAIAMPSKSLNEIAPRTIATAHQNGWRWQIPLQHRVGNGLVYSSAYMDEESATELLIQSLPSEGLAEPRKLSWVNGKRTKAWEKNCIAIGLSQGFIEPLESTGLHLIQSAISKLLALFPNQQPSSAQISAYNRYTDEEISAIKDFVIMHYKLSQRDDSEFWRYCKNMAIPERLQAKMDLYEQSAHVFRDNNELFNEISWFSVMHGQGLQPQTYHPMVDVMNEQQRITNLQRIAGAMRESVASMQPHKLYLENYVK